MLVVSNHVSWLDSLVLDAVQPMAMVAKLDIKGWPLLGKLAVRGADPGPGGYRDRGGAAGADAARRQRGGAR